MSDLQHLETAYKTIVKGLRGARKPYILSSFGKDSLAVIDLCAAYEVRNVLYLEDRDEAVDEDHIAKTIERYKLEVTRMHSGRAVLYFIRNQPHLLAFPFVSDSLMLPIPTNMDPYVDGEPFTCVDDRLGATAGRRLFTGADLLIMGFKVADWESNTCRTAVDALDDAAKATYMARYQPIMPLGQGVRVAFPLLDWTHDMVWDYLDYRCVTASELMYDGRVKRPHPNRMCYRCHDPQGPAIVLCPKLNQGIMNLAHFTKDDDLKLERLVRIGVLSHDEAAQLRRPNG